MVGASAGAPVSKFTIVGESEGSTLDRRGRCMSVAESEGGIMPEEELSPGERVRPPAPPFAGSPDLFGGRPRLDSSIVYPDPCRARQTEAAELPLACARAQRADPAGRVS